MYFPPPMHVFVFLIFYDQPINGSRLINALLLMYYIMVYLMDLSYNVWTVLLWETRSLIDQNSNNGDKWCKFSSEVQSDTALGTRIYYNEQWSWKGEDTCGLLLLVASGKSSLGVCSSTSFNVRPVINLVSASEHCQASNIEFRVRWQKCWPGMRVPTALNLTPDFFHKFLLVELEYFRIIPQRPYKRWF